MRPRAARRGWRFRASVRRLAALACCVVATAAPAASDSGHCDAQARLTAGQKDVLFRFGAVIKAELEATGARAVLMARSGLDLGRFGIRYSHAGVSLKASPETPWAIRQLYYACDEKRPRLFDQGLAAFLLGTSRPDLGYVSVVLLPPAAEAALEAAALDRATALGLLGADYSANAHAFSTRYQNCNQWLAELLAAAWGGIDLRQALPPPGAERPGPDAASATDARAAAAGASAASATSAASAASGDSDLATPRARAQRWLRDAGYEGSAVELGSSAWRVVAAFVPWLHEDDHPPEDLHAARYRISLPAALESFARARHAGQPGLARIEFCHDSRQVIVRRGWRPLAEGCRPEPGDEVRPLP